MEQLVVSHPEWAGKVTSVLMNQANMQAGIPSCSSLTKIPILQDNAQGTLWASMGVTAKGIAVVDQAGVLKLYLPGGTFPNTQVETLVNELIL